MPFEDNVFINCPFDDQYKKLLQPLLFTLMYCGLNPRLALERFDASELRINKILELIEESQYSIHDLSRIKSSSKNEIARFNMPFELGIDFGCKNFKGGQHLKKKFIIIEKEKFTYQIALSDISGYDIRQHKNDPRELVIVIRNWIRENINPQVENGPKIFDNFNAFMADFSEKRLIDGYKDQDDLDKIPVSEYMNFIEQWVKATKV